MHEFLNVFQNGIFLAITAHGLIGASLIWDKILLKQPETKNLVSYVFWLGAISIFGLILIFFGFRMPSLAIATIAFVAGVVHLAANFFYYAALKFGEASQALAMMGGFSPLATALIGIPLLRRPLGGDAIPGFALLTIGGFVMFLSEKINLKKVMPFVVSAAGTFGLVNVLEKVAYDSTNFVTGYVFFTAGTFAGSMFLLIRKSWRKQIFEQTEQASPRSQFWYMVNRFISGVGSFLVFYSISKANPAVVDAISGVRYALIFVLAYSFTRWKSEWLSENFSTRTLIAKSVATAVIVAGLVLLALGGGETAGSS